jgi:hypothetical protein
MPISIHVIDGDFAVDSRGKLLSTSGHKKISNQINYALSNSPYIQALVSSLKTNSPSANEWAIRDAIVKTINVMIQEHRDNPYLPADERVKSISELVIDRFDSTSFEFFVSVKTYRGVPFTLSLTRTFNG